MSRHFSATILLEAPWPLDVDELAGAVRERFPQIGVVEPVPGQADARESAVLTLDGAQIVIELAQTPFPAAETTPPLETVQAWDPAPALRAHRARLSVTCGGSMPGIISAKSYAAATHFVTAAATDLSLPLAVFWHHGWTMNDPRSFLDATAELAAGRMPVDTWVGFAPVVPQGYEPAEAIGMVSYGMRPMLGRELELAPRPGDPKIAHECLRGIAAQILDRGLELRDGMRIQSGAIKFTVRARTYWLRRNESAFVIIADDAVIDQKTLRPRERNAA